MISDAFERETVGTGSLPVPFFFIGTHYDGQGTNDCRL